MKSMQMLIGVVIVLLGVEAGAVRARGDVRAWEGEITIPTYVWHEDINPTFWALEGGAKLSTTVRGAIVYPYVMQDHLLREKVERSYKALFLENEYLKVICLPELGGRLLSVLDKTENEEMFYRNHVVKPGMIAMRGAWISGGVEWNPGPHGHTVTAISPVDAMAGTNKDGSAYLLIGNQEKLFRTRWSVRVTLHPGRAYLDEEICLANVTDGMHPYYFWNCTAFPNRPGTRFIYPMSLGTDHNAREFFHWPIDKGRDLSWLKNYETYASIFSVNCSYDFFGAYDVDADRGIVQVANRRELGGKKAWTWGEWEFGKVSQQNLTDGDGPYIEVQSGPLPTQSDYGMLGPREQVRWREWWYPVHGLGDGFEYATRDVAIQSHRAQGRVTLRLIATAEFPGATCEALTIGKQPSSISKQVVDLSPHAAVCWEIDDPQRPMRIRITDGHDRVLAVYQTPLPIPAVEPPQRDPSLDRPDEQLTVEQLYLKGRQADRATDRRAARRYYEKAIAADAGHVDSLRSLAVLDYEAGLYAEAYERLRQALQRDSDDGLCCYYLGLCALKLGDLAEALDGGAKTVRCSGTVSLGYDLQGRVLLKQGRRVPAVGSFEQAVRANGNDTLAADHLMLALYRAGRAEAALKLARKRVTVDPLAIVPSVLLALDSDASMQQFGQSMRTRLGECDFEVLEASLMLAEFGLIEEAQRMVEAACIDAVAPDRRGFLPMYYLAWLASLQDDKDRGESWLHEAAKARSLRVFASRPEEIAVLQYATLQNPSDGQAHLQLGCLFANLGRLDEAAACWQEAVEHGAGSIAWRNLALVAAAGDDVQRAEACFRQAIAAQPDDQTLYRDLSELLIADNRRTEAITLLESMPLDGPRRAELTVTLAESYMAEKQFEKCIDLLESLPYFVNWEGQDITWRLFNAAHLERGQQRLNQGDTAGALADFEAALTYPENLNVGRSNKPVEAPAQYWRGVALESLGRVEEARAAWKFGAEGAEVAGQQNEYREKCRAALAAPDQ